MQPSYTQKLTVERIFITSDLVWSWFKLFGKGAWDMWWRMSAMHSALDTSSYCNPITSFGYSATASGLLRHCYILRHCISTI